MTLNHMMVVERYPNRTKWLAVRFPAVKSPLYLTKNYPGDQAPLMFKKKKNPLVTKLK